jgi:hypothetical protein
LQGDGSVVGVADGRWGVGKSDGGQKVLTQEQHRRQREQPDQRRTQSKRFCFHNFLLSELFVSNG